MLSIEQHRQKALVSKTPFVVKKAVDLVRQQTLLNRHIHSSNMLTSLSDENQHFAYSITVQASSLFTFTFTNCPHGLPGLLVGLTGIWTRTVLVHLGRYVLDFCRHEMTRSRGPLQ